MTLLHLISEVIAARSRGRAVAETILIETRGSTPQKAGARMLVYPDGSQQGTLGGGCVEAEIKRAALECLQKGTGRIVSLVLDHDYGWDDGLICGGRMTALIQPASEASARYHAVFRGLLEQGAGLTELLPVEDHSGNMARYLLNGAGVPVEQLGETPFPPEVLGAVRSLQERPQPYTAAGYCFLPELPICRLVIVGAGHVGKALTKYARDLEFEVTLVDDRAEYCNADNVPEASQHVVGRFEDVLPSLPIDQNTFCVIVTRGHNHDEEALLHLVRRQPRYLGMIGSRRKIRLIFDDLLRQGIPQEQLDRVQAPIGIDIASRTVPEIAISIAAQLVDRRNRVPRESSVQES